MQERNAIFQKQGKGGRAREAGQGRQRKGGRAREAGQGLRVGGKAAHQASPRSSANAIRFLYASMAPGTGRDAQGRKMPEPTAW